MVLRFVPDFFSCGQGETARWNPLPLHLGGDFRHLLAHMDPATGGGASARGPRSSRRTGGSGGTVELERSEENGSSPFLQAMQLKFN